MKILFFTNNFIDASRGGVEFHVAALAGGLADLGHSVTIVRTSNQASIHDAGHFDLILPLAKEDESNNRRIGRNINFRSIRMIQNFSQRVDFGLRIAKWVRENIAFIETFDLVHHHDFVTSYFVSREIVKYSKIRQFWTNHLGEFVLLNRLPIVGNFTTKFLSRNYLHAFAPSHELANKKGISCQVDMVPNGADLDLFRPLTAKTRNELRWALGWGSDFVVIVPRRWAPLKGVLYAAQASKILELKQEVRFVFVGAKESDFPEYAAEIRKLLSESQGKKTVIDSASQNEMARLLASSDLTLIPSLFEAVCLSAVESLACEVPIVASNLGGLPDVVIEGYTGFLVEAKSPTQIAEAVARALELHSKQQLSMLGQSGRKLVEENYSWEKIISRYEGCYETFY
jgi:glycosyltransferase involved in cell wall biosynthesis